MTPDQRRLLRNSFDLLRDQTGPFALLFYGKLFELDPGARRLFHNDLVAQGNKVMDMLTSVVESLENTPAIRSELLELGKRHSEYGVRPEQYGTVGAAMLWALTQALGPDFDGPTREAWRVALQSICDMMKAGAI
jgi:hemoglobin-like flavoprotein